jgi:hypothetical protein
MKEVLDLYSKLLIATFTFIGPSFTLLIPIFYAAFLRSKANHQEVLSILQAIHIETIRDDRLRGLTNGYQRAQKLINQNRKEIRLLNPRRQVKRIFFTLVLAIVLMLFYYFQASEFWVWKIKSLKIVTLVLSIASFVSCVLILWQLFCTIIKIKQHERENPILPLT